MPMLHTIQSSSSGQNYARSHNKPTITTELQLNLQKHINVVSIKYRWREKNSAARKFWPNGKFWLFL